MKAVTRNPARVLMIDKYKGEIAIGKQADVLLLDSKLNIEKVFANCKIVFSSEQPG